MLEHAHRNEFLSRVNCQIIRILLLTMDNKMTSNIVKNFAAVTVAGTLLSFVVATTTVSVAAIINVTMGHSASKTGVSFMQR